MTRLEMHSWCFNGFVHQSLGENACTIYPIRSERKACSREQEKRQQFSIHTPHATQVPVGHSTSEGQAEHGKANASARRVFKLGSYLVCSFRMACLAVSGESDAEPGAFFTGANSSCRCTSSSATRSARGNVSKMNSSSFMPCICTKIQRYPLSAALWCCQIPLVYQDDADGRWAQAPCTSAPSVVRRAWQREMCQGRTAPG